MSKITHLKELESESIYVLREVAAQFERPAILFSGGKDSIVIVHLAYKAFYPAKIPFPLVHIDTGHNFQETIDYRDALAERLGAELIVGSVQESIDTGRLFPETYQLIDKTNLTYNIKLEVFFPDYREVQRMIREEGINLFYNSIESRHRCCQIRKLEPLARAFQGLDVWICGLRREQSVTRQDMQVVEWDEMHQLIKVNPLISWTEQQVWDYIKMHSVPYNKLHDRGYPSIGCEPCTRAVQPGEDVRSGRWWWESPDHRECGLHQRH